MIWKVIPRHLSYEVSDGGDVRRIGVPRPLRTSAHRGGYRMVSLGQGTKYTVHSLVMLAFSGPRPLHHDVNHKNGDKADNRWANLEYLSRGDNHRHAYQLGLMERRWGEENPQCKVSQEAIAQMKKLRAAGWTQKAIAEKFRISRPHVSNVLSGKARQCG